MRMQGILTAQPALNMPASKNMFDVQLNYNPNQVLDPDSWDSNFHAVLLYGFIEHLTSDAINIKESLIRMKKYISGKSIESEKANKIQDLMGMGKALWDFINVVYESQWDALFVENNTIFRNKVKVKFNPQLRKDPPPSNNKDKAKPTFVLPMPSPIPAKLLKEVKEISKFFKKIKKLSPKKSYAQASSNSVNNSNISNIAINTLNIKETFLKLLNEKINTIQKVINSGNAKPKPKINITTKGLLRKQIIIPMPNELGKIFTKDSTTHIININHILKNTKSSICVDYISSDNKSTSIVTNNIALNSDLQEIKKYIKQSLDNNNSITPLDYLSLNLTSKLLAFHTTSTNPTLASLTRILNTSSKTPISLIKLSSPLDQGLESLKFCQNQTWQ